MYGLLFVSLFTSSNWGYDFSCAQGEIFRFDRIRLFEQANIYHLFAVVFFLILFFRKFGPTSERNILGDRNYLKNIFLVYFIPINILIYFTVYIKNITLVDLGVSPIVTFFVYLIVTFYVQDIFLKNKSKVQLDNILTSLEILIFLRCCYSIIKYLLGFGATMKIFGETRLGQENDFADFFILLFIIALTRLLFDKDENKKHWMLHITGIVTSSIVAIFSFRRYFWGEFLIALSIILFFYYRFNKVNFNKIIISVAASIVLMISLFLFVGQDKLAHNYYVGRLLTSLSLINPQYESQYGTNTGHVEEIKDGWYNVKKNFVLGITPFGRMQRFKTKSWQPGTFVHNAYLYVWLQYGLLGFALFVYMYFKSIQLGRIVFFRSKASIGLILLAFMICQMVKNIVWPTAIIYTNITIIYIFLISLVLKGYQVENYQKKD